MPKAPSGSSPLPIHLTCALPDDFFQAGASIKTFVKTPPTTGRA